MIWLLWILISLAIGLTAFTFFPSGDRLQENSGGNFQNKTEATLGQLKDRVLFLESESKKVNHLCLSIKEDLSDLKEKDLTFIIDLLKRKETSGRRESFSGQESLKLQEYEKTVGLLREEVEELSHKLIKLTLEVNRLEEEGEKKDRFIAESKRKEEQLRKLSEEIRLRSRKVINELSETKARELKLMADLFKAKAIYSDSEKELERLTGENAELRDDLSYELHN